MIGQPHIEAALAKRVHAYRTAQVPIAHLAFEASRGMGKTLIMTTAANMFELVPIETAFKRGTQLDKAINNLRNQWRRGSVWIVDELHNLSVPNQMALKKLVESGTYTTNGGDDIDIPQLVVFTAFTDRSLIDPELLDRFIVFRFSPYDSQERLDILFSYANEKGIELPYDDAEMIATANQTPRDLRKAIDSAVILNAIGEKITSISVFNEQGKDSDGLDLFSRRVLITVADLLGKQVKATLEIVADSLRISQNATRLVLSELSSLGYLKTSPGTGRSLTNKGWEKVDSIRSE